MIHSLPGGKRGQAPVTLSSAASAGARATASKRRHHGCPRALGWRAEDPTPSSGRGSAGGRLEGTKGREAPSSATSLLQGQQGRTVPEYGGSLLWWEGVRAPSRCQAVGRLGGALGPLDDGRALLPPQQLVVLKETLVAGHAVRAIGEGQETCGGEGSAGSEEAGAAPTGDGAPGKKGRSGRCWKGPCRCQHSPKP